MTPVVPFSSGEKIIGRVGLLGNLKVIFHGQIPSKRPPKVGLIYVIVSVWPAN